MPYDAASPLAPPQRNGILDPLTAALLQAGFAGLNAAGPSRTPVSFGQVFGRAGQAGMAAYDAADTRLRNEALVSDKRAEEQRLHDAQIGDLEAKAEQRRQEVELERAQMEYLKRPEVQAAVKAGNIGGVLAGMPKLQARDLGILKPNKPQADEKIIRLMKQRDLLPQGHPDRKVLEAAIKKESEHQPQVGVYASSLVEGVDQKTGAPVFVQPSPRADTPPRIVEGVRPKPDKPTATDMRSQRDREENTATVASVRQRVKAMQDKLQSDSYIVGIGGAVRRGAEAVGGLAVPDLKTPALDYQNDLRLLLADVRKIVEKDPNLSTKERENLEQALGGGVFQTPGSAFRALNNVLDFVESKKMTGPSRDAKLENIVKGAGWNYEPDKYEYRVLDGKVQRRAKGK